MTGERRKGCFDFPFVPADERRPGGRPSPDVTSRVMGEWGNPSAIGQDLWIHQLQTDARKPSANNNGVADESTFIRGKWQDVL